jgi:hypothetical protein
MRILLIILWCVGEYGCVGQFRETTIRTILTPWRSLGWMIELGLPRCITDHVH